MVQRAIETEAKRGGLAEAFTVLLVEDNPNDARLIEVMLEDAGAEWFDLEQVESLGQGLERVERGDIGVILLDLTLPDSRGLDTFTLMHAAAPGIPIIVLSGLDDTRMAVQAVHEGAQDFLLKGQVSAQILVRAMRYAIERKRMVEQLGRYAEELRSRNVQLESDLNMARELQEIYLPHSYPTFPESAAPGRSAIQFAHRYLPAAAVGGDFFDIFPINKSAAGIFICDVMGHGLRAALVTGIIRGLVEELVTVAADPGRFVAEINRSLRAILRRTRDPFLATAFYLVADVAAGEIRFANAGHPSPLQLRLDTGEVQSLKELDSRHGPALGLFDQPSYPSCRSAADRQHRFLLFTDGLHEAEDAMGEEYGLLRLRAAAARHLHLSAPRMLDMLIEDARRFTGNHEFADDLCLVTVGFDHGG